MSDSNNQGYTHEDPYLEAALQAPPSPDYVSGPEEPEQAPPSPDYVLEPDPEADPEEDDDEDPEEDPIDYPADGGDNGDDEMDIEEDEDADMDIDADEEDEDDEMDVEIDEEAEEEHSAPAYHVVVALPATVPSAEETEPFETDESVATTSPCISEDRPEVNLPPRMGLGIALGPGYEVGESSAAAAARPAGGFRADYGFFVLPLGRRLARTQRDSVGYGITESMDEIVETLQGAPDNTTERDDSTTGTGHHTAGAGDSLTGTGDDITWVGYCITGTAGTRWGSCTAGAARGGGSSS
ncbi:hypothetical protein Tco_0893455 [Tanacetum coccineum]|uniref:Uncharacterized protein n=1 Tax=Tanacetum coccineum TaxID=301880 RepID=A0ABQ5CBZ4_9ASTR